MSGFDERAGMSPERREEVRRELGLDSLPVPRYEDMPEVSDAAWAMEKYNFQKALKCVDNLASAQFMGQYLMPSCIIDQSIDPHAFRRGWSQSSYIDAGVPIPVNKKITAATGITSDMNESNWYTWVAQNVAWRFEESGARAMSPVLIWRTSGLRKHGRYVKGSKLLGWLYTLDRTPRPGQTVEDAVRQVGILHPSDMQAANKVLPVAGALLPEGLTPPNPGSDDEGVFS